MRLRPIEPSSPAFEAFEDALIAAGLPTADLVGEGARYYAMGETPQEAQAFVGLAPLGDEALLRSVVVPIAGRGAGRGGVVVDLVADLAATYGVRRLWLLTTDGEGYFKRHDFRVVPRGDAPAKIVALQQFSVTCPATAVLMCRTLA
ncbi:tyrosine protein phosphatase [Phenylobacterium sp.]|uniref:tyrosine protein phosphatase n=1 Tax=Phenylobacterium sp. TaxID=1871053 RepID=UPI002737C293|nr:tyrosine protein phosphatase [Phenylobacterium sp.]MDP3869367.1 tyrosine protein phosphatase [Phenylobacterium sp.]